jgi:hypothetical protein
MSTYASDTEIGTALAVHRARLQDGLAFSAFLECAFRRSGNSKCNESQSKDNGGFEKLHDYEADEGKCE